MLLCELAVLGTDPLPHGSEILGPLGWDEGSGAGVPASEPHGPRDAVRIRQQYASHDGRVDRSRAPGRVALGVAVPRLLMERQAVDLQPDDHPRQLQVERGSDLRCRRAQVPLEAFAFRVAQLSEPSELQHGQHRQQDEHGCHQPREHRRTPQTPLHERKCNTRKQATFRVKGGFYKLNNLFAPP